MIDTTLKIMHIILLKLFIIVIFTDSGPVPLPAEIADVNLSDEAFSII